MSEPKKPHRIRNKTDILMMAAAAGALIATGVFRPRWIFSSIPWALFAVLAVIAAYAVIAWRPRRRIGFLLIAAGLGTLLAIPSNWGWSWYDQKNLEADFEQQSSAAMVLNQSILDGLEGAASKEKLKQLANAFSQKVTDEQAIGQLEIPRIGVNGIIVEGTEEASLSKGIGHMEGYPFPGMGGNFSVAGDRVLYGAPFLNLDEMAVGDQIKVKTTYGRFEYVVSSITKVSPEDTSVLASNGTDMITLITCDPPWGTSQRLIVQGVILSAELL